MMIIITSNDLEISRFSYIFFSEDATASSTAAAASSSSSFKRPDSETLPRFPHDYDLQKFK